jgi:hypothetical protein
MLYPIELRARLKLMFFPACAPDYAAWPNYAALIPSNSASLLIASRTTLEKAKPSFACNALVVFMAALSITSDFVTLSLLAIV